MAKTRRKAGGGRESDAAKQKRIKELQEFLGYDVDAFALPSRGVMEVSYFGWWFDPPRLVDLQPPNFAKLEKEYIISSSNDFWEVVKEINWKVLRKKGADAQDAVGEKLKEKYSDDERIGFNNHYTILRFWIDRVLAAYVTATIDPPGTSDDGTWDLESECIGRGKDFYMKCITQPHHIVKLAKAGDFYENFGYILDRAEPESAGDGDRISWSNFQTGARSPKSRGVLVDRALCRQFQIAYSMI